MLFPKHKHRHSDLFRQQRVREGRVKPSNDASSGDEVEKDNSAVSARKKRRKAREPKPSEKRYDNASSDRNPNPTFYTSADDIDDFFSFSGNEHDNALVTMFSSTYQNCVFQLLANTPLILNTCRAQLHSQDCICTDQTIHGGAKFHGTPWSNSLCDIRDSAILNAAPLSQPHAWADQLVKAAKVERALESDHLTSLLDPGVIIECVARKEWNCSNSSDGAAILHEVMFQYDFDIFIAKTTISEAHGVCRIGYNSHGIPCYNEFIFSFAANGKLTKASFQFQGNEKFF